VKRIRRAEKYALPNELTEYWASSSSRGVTRVAASSIVIAEQAGIQRERRLARYYVFIAMDPRMRGDDKLKLSKIKYQNN
jgi:hypothetical protein